MQLQLDEVGSAGESHQNDPSVGRQLGGSGALIRREGGNIVTCPNKSFRF